MAVFQLSQIFVHDSNHQYEPGVSKNQLDYKCALAETKEVITATFFFHVLHVFISFYVIKLHCLAFKTRLVFLGVGWGFVTGFVFGVFGFSGVMDEIITITKTSAAKLPREW